MCGTEGQATSCACVPALIWRLTFSPIDPRPSHDKGAKHHVHVTVRAGTKLCNLPLEHGNLHAVSLAQAGGWSVPSKAIPTKFALGVLGECLIWF